jgi:dienelactone hydrolase
MSEVVTEWRRLPPLGGAPDPVDAAALEAELAGLEDDLATASIASGVADVAVLTKAVRWALRFDEFWDPARYVQDGDTSIGVARRVLAMAAARLRELRRGGRPSWSTQTGRLVRGYISSVDDSAQPFGLQIPEWLQVDAAAPGSVPLMVWLHGRGDQLTDLHFIDRCLFPGAGSAFQGLAEADPLTTTHIVLHAFGRSCLGYKSAAETDIYEAISAAKQMYACIDADRISLAGFSMGGSGTYHLAAHRPDQWVVAHAGAAFAETYHYTKGGGASGGTNDQSGAPWYEKVLWGVYDTPCYARSLCTNVPFIGYNGADDASTYPQSTSIMEAAFAEHGARMELILAPNTPHAYEGTALTEVVRRMQRHIAAGIDRQPDEVRIQTRTLRYGSAHWVDITGLIEHWVDSRLDALRYHPTAGPEGAVSSQLTVTTTNIRSFIARANSSFDGVQIVVDGQEVSAPRATQMTAAHLFRDDTGEWSWVESQEALWPSEGLHKVPGLQGPIDDAFMSRFCFVSPLATGSTRAADEWAEFEMKHSTHRWEAVRKIFVWSDEHESMLTNFCVLRMQVFRGSPLTVSANDVDDTMLGQMQCNLVLWGTPQTNRHLATFFAKIQADACITWNDSTIAIGPRHFDARTHALIMVYPSPWSDGHYVVVNSCVTHREEDDRTNALQNPKLPDYAVVDLSEAPTSNSVGKVVAADFFDEGWCLKTSSLLKTMIP